MLLVMQPCKPRSLPETLRLTFSWRKGMPHSWRQWLQSLAYWNAELEE